MAKYRDDLWLGVKDQPRSDIADFSQNLFQWNVWCWWPKVEHSRGIFKVQTKYHISNCDNIYTLQIHMHIYIYIAIKYDITYVKYNTWIS